VTSRAATGALFLGAGVLWLLSLADVVEPSYQTWVGLLLVAIGLAIALTRGHHGLLVVLGVAVMLAGLPALVVGDVVGRDVGEAIATPATSAELVRYEHGVGQLTVDLTAPGLATEDLEIEAEIGIGELLVLVPQGADVVVDAHVGVGDIDALGTTEGGVNVDLDTRVPGTGDQQITLRLEAGLGEIRVERR
jgi:hypothetical protein